MSEKIGISPTTKEFLKRIERLADQVDGMTRSAKMPGLSASIRVASMADELAEIRDEMREAYREFSGQDPWAPERDDSPSGDD